MDNNKVTLEEYISEKTGQKIRLITEDEFIKIQLQKNRSKKNGFKNKDIEGSVNYEEFIFNDKVYYVKNIPHLNIEDISGYVYIILTKNEKDMVKELCENLFPNDKIFIYGKFVCIVSKIVEKNKEMILKTAIETELFQITKIIYLGKSVNHFEVEKKIKTAEKYLSVHTDFFKSEIRNIKEILLENILSATEESKRKEFLEVLFNSVDISQVDSEIINTAIGFIENDFNISKASKKLYIHRNTLLYRIDKVNQLFDIDVRHFKDALLFYIGIIIYRKYY